MNELAEILDAVRDDLLVARVALERDDLASSAQHLQQASTRLQGLLDTLAAGRAAR